MNDEPEVESKPKRRIRAWYASSPEEREAREQDDEAWRAGRLPPKRNNKRLNEL